MDIRKFLQPSFKKIVFAIVIFILLPTVPHKVQIVCTTCIVGEYCPPCPPGHTEFFSPFYILTKFCHGRYYLGCLGNFLRTTPLSIIPILGLLVSYILSSAIIYLWNRRKACLPAGREQFR